MARESSLEDRGKPLAGNCPHEWQDLEGPYVVAQICKRCKLYRYKSSLTADWEYRAPIPIVGGGRGPVDE